MQETATPSSSGYAIVCVNCPAGTTLTGGGAELTGLIGDGEGLGPRIISSAPFNPNQWIAEGACAEHVAVEQPELAVDAVRLRAVCAGLSDDPGRPGPGRAPGRQVRSAPQSKLRGRRPASDAVSAAGSQTSTEQTGQKSTTDIDPSSSRARCAPSHGPRVRVAAALLAEEHLGALRFELVVHTRVICEDAGGDKWPEQTLVARDARGHRAGDVAAFEPGPAHENVGVLRRRRSGRGSAFRLHAARRGASRLRRLPHPHRRNATPHPRRRNGARDSFTGALGRYRLVQCDMRLGQGAPVATGSCCDAGGRVSGGRGY